MCLGLGHKVGHPLNPEFPCKVLIPRKKQTWRYRDKRQSTGNRTDGIVGRLGGSDG